MIKLLLILAIAGVSGILAYYLFNLYKKKFMGLQDQFRDALKKVALRYGSAIAVNVEKIYRLETANFTSGQFKGTFSPGMEKTTNVYPYGWQSLATGIWDTVPSYKPIGLLPFTENGTGITKYFIKFPSVEAAVMTLAEFLRLHENNPGRWFSLASGDQNKYNSKIAQIKTPFFNEIT